MCFHPRLPWSALVPVQNAMSLTTVISNELGLVLLFVFVAGFFLAHHLPSKVSSISLLYSLGNGWQSTSRLPTISAWQTTRKVRGGMTYEELLRDGHNMHGSVFAVEDPFLSRRIVITDPLALKHIQVRHATNYPKATRAKQALRFQLANGLILHDGE